MKILEELWGSGISDSKCSYYLSNELIAATKNAADAEKELCEVLNEDARHAFAEYQECQQELIVLTDKSTFAKGFCMGAKIMMEILEK